MTGKLISGARELPLVLLAERVERAASAFASIGIGPNKLIAKMASGVNKPRGLTLLDEEGFRSLFWPLDVQELWGVGPKLATRRQRRPTSQWTISVSWQHLERIIGELLPTTDQCPRTKECA